LECDLLHTSPFRCPFKYPLSGKDRKKGCDRMCPGRPTTQELIIKLSAGDPGATLVLLQIVGREPNPNDLLLDIDRLGLCGARIWGLYKDVCGENLDLFAKLIRHQKMFGW
jgi:hypothetical protein